MTTKGGMILKRVIIRDRRSNKKVKPRIFDYIQKEDGTEWLETKDDKTIKTILLNDFLNQLEEARKAK